MGEILDRVASSQYPLYLWLFQLLKAFLQFIIQSVIVLLWIHDSMDLSKLSYPISSHILSYNKFFFSLCLTVEEMV